jgi:tripeptidyl-peptidase-1
LNWIVAVAAASDIPLVHSISYGSIEKEEPPTELQQFDQEAMKLGARGVTIMSSSGDDGVANFVARSDPSQCGFSPSFPATATNVVTVGATQGPESGTAEIACSSATGGVVTTGGGFSTVFSQPSYQSSAVADYFKTNVTFPPTSQYNQAGRGYPDVALLGYNYEVIIGGVPYGVSGTSCSSPTFAGLVSLVNDARISAGKSSLGLLNQALYSLSASVYNDITSGENNCCAGTEGSQVCCQYGFYAAKGWDPLTGLGSVHFNKLLSALVAL